MKQFVVLARAVGENASSLPDCAEIRALQAELVDEMNAKGYKTTFFDMHTVTEGLEADYPDLLHPNDKGHTAMAKALAPALESLIETMRP
jgi:lysophospholipase L1-like esterase